MIEEEVEGKYIIVKREKADRICLLKELTYDGANPLKPTSARGLGGLGPSAAPAYVTGPQANAGRGFNASALYKYQPQALAA